MRIYRELHNNCRKTIREAKLHSWMEFLETINEGQSSGEIWNSINAISGKRRSSPMQLQTPNGFVGDPTEIADELGVYFASLSAGDQYQSTFVNRVHPTRTAIFDYQVRTDCIDVEINRAFTFEELGFALGQSNGKSAGPDEIGYPLLKNLPLAGKMKLLELFNKLWTSDSFPEQWRESLVIPIPKANSTTNDVTKFRPIALTCCMGKVLERMANRRLKEFLEGHGLLDNRQHAFRQGFGTSTYFASLGEILKEAIANGDHAEVVSLDISKAFNRTWTPLVIRQLEDWGLGGHIVYFVRNFLLDRTFRVGIGNEKSRIYREETGVPQGSVLAVTLFLVAMNGVFKNLPKNVHVLLYADDILIVATGPTVARTRIKAQATASSVARWAASVGFELSAAKSVRCHICSSTHTVRGPSIKIANQPIPLKKSIRVLGVLLDRRFSFTQHFQAVKASCRSRINLIKTISRRHRSNNREIRFRVARAIIDSRLMYGLEITASAEEKLLEILGPVYNSYVRIISGLLPSTPADAACAEAGVLPFRFLFYTAVANKAAVHASKTSGRVRIHLLDEGNGVLRRAANVKLPPVAKVHWHGGISWQSHKPKMENGIKANFRAGDNSEVLRRTVIELLRTKYPNHVHRYTDGSLSRSGVGFGVHGEMSPASYSLPKQCSVFSAEAAAILVGVKTPADRPLLIVSDSHSVLQALTSNTPNHPWIQGILKHAPANTTYAWIPGHCGVEGNVVADSLAGAGPSGPRYTKAVPLLDIKRWVKKIFWQTWEQEWSGNRTLFLRKIKGDTGKWEDLRGLRDQQVISRLRTGHSRLSHNFGGGNFRKTCDICRVPSTTEHLLCECSKYSPLREAYGLPHSVRDILGNEISSATTVISFLKDARLYNQI